MRSDAVEKKRFLTALGALSDRVPGFFGAPWLRSTYEAPTWDIHVGCTHIRLNFGVRLDDGLELTHQKHANLLDSFKSFILVQTHLERTGGIVYAPSTVKSRVGLAIHICEYLLINAEELRLARYGLQAIGESDGYRMFRRLATMPSAQSVFQWPERIAGLLREEGAKLDEREIASCLLQFPELAHVEQSTLGFSRDELIRARVWAWLRGYLELSTCSEGHGYIFRSAMVKSRLYPRGTLGNHWHMPVYRELCVFRRPFLDREMQGAPVRGEVRSEAILRDYVKVVKPWAMLSKVGLSVPRGLVHAAQNSAFLNEVSGAPAGRYTTLPHSVVLASLRNAVEFWFAYGSDLLQCYGDLAAVAMEKGLNLSEAIVQHNNLVPESLRRLGITCWSIRDRLQAQYRSARTERESPIWEPRYFDGLRLNQGLYELLQVLGGSLLVVLGALMARRQGELADLICGDMLDASGTRLAFDARKRGASGIRDKLLRPIPPVAAEMLKLIELFQRNLVQAGVLLELTTAFSFPKRLGIGLAAARDDALNAMLDLFCDYFEVEADVRGRRYYIRQHQLRRFFAILFFWGNSFSGLDCLGWFLGHTDLEHLYHYITESIPGAVLRGVKTDYAVEKLQAGRDDCAPLLALVQRRFGARAITLLDQEELGEYIEELLAVGEISIEPEFFQGAHGKEYRILIVVTPRSDM